MNEVDQEEIDGEFYLIRSTDGRHIELLMDSEEPLSPEEFCLSLKSFVEFMELNPAGVFRSMLNIHSHKIQ